MKESEDSFDPLDDDHLREECGIFAVYDHPNAAEMTYLGLYALQHRGEEDAGIATRNGSKVYLHKSQGLVSDVFDEKSLSGLRGDAHGG